MNLTVWVPSSINLVEDRGSKLPPLTLQVILEEVEDNGPIKSFSVKFIITRTPSDAGVAVANTLGLGVDKVSNLVIQAVVVNTMVNTFYYNIYRIFII